MRDEDLTERPNVKRKKEAGISTRAFPLESLSYNLIYEKSIFKL